MSALALNMHKRWHKAKPEDFNIPSLQKSFRFYKYNIWILNRV